MVTAEVTLVVAVVVVIAVVVAVVDVVIVVVVVVMVVGHPVPRPRSSAPVLAPVTQLSFGIVAQPQLPVHRSAHVMIAHGSVEVVVVSVNEVVEEDVDVTRLVVLLHSTPKLETKEASFTCIPDSVQ